MKCEESSFTKQGWRKENPYLFLEDWRRNDAKMIAF